MRCICRIFFAVAVVGFLAVPAAWAHVDPAGASESGAGQRIGLFDDAACTVAHPEGQPITDCQTMYIRATLVWTGLPGSSFEQGRWRLEANGVEIADITPAGNVPCIGDPVNSINDPALPGGRGNCAGAPNEFQSVCVPYTPNAADIASTGIFFQALWGEAFPMDPNTGFTHRSDNDNPGASATASEFIGIEPCPVDECNQGCVPATGQCTPFPFSTECSDTDGNECTVAGCDGVGSCDQNHILPDSQSCTPDNPADPQCATAGCDGTGVCDPFHILEDFSTACDDTDGNECTIAGCDGAGVCDQLHMLPDSQLCTPANPADPQCATPGCDGAGNCDPLHIVEDFSTACDDTDGNDCTIAGCDGEGVCDQLHMLPDSQSCTPANPADPQCATAGCDGAGNCDPLHIVQDDSTMCNDTDGNECTMAGCDGMGVCDQNHVLPDSQSCTPANPADPECATPGCDGAGNCDPLHIVQDNSTVCTDTDGNVCTEAGCDGLGVCDQNHVLPDSKACTDDDGNACSIAGCDGAGSCDQKHICDPDLCPITIGDFIWNDGNMDGQQDAEPGIPGVDLSLVDCADDSVVDMASTDGSGLYSFGIKVNPVTCEFDNEYEIQVDDSNFMAGGSLVMYMGSPNDVGSDLTDSDCINDAIPCTTYTSDDSTRDCGYFPPGGEAICRTPGFWGTHGGITDDLIAHARGSIEVCGNTITNGLEYGSLDDALEGLCVPVKGYSVRQLYRQLVAARLNCQISMAGECGALIPYYSECDALCAGEVIVDGVGLTVNDCIDAIDCFNNGGVFDVTDGQCKTGNCNTDGSLCNTADDCQDGGGDDGGDIGDCCADNGTPGCNDTTCQDLVCGGGEPDTCNCCAGGDGLGCDDTDCEATVCAVDTFCCNTAWDSVCDGEAADLCGCCDGLEADPFCCDTEWDSICADQAAQIPECGCDGGDGGDGGLATAATGASDGTSDATPGMLVGLMDSGPMDDTPGGGIVECIKFESCHDRDLCPDPEMLPELCYEPVGKVDLPKTSKECNAANKSDCAIVPLSDPKAGGCKECEDVCDPAANP